MGYLLLAGTPFSQLISLKMELGDPLGHCEIGISLGVWSDFSPLLSRSHFFLTSLETLLIAEVAPLCSSPSSPALQPVTHEPLSEVGSTSHTGGL